MNEIDQKKVVNYAIPNYETTNMKTVTQKSKLYVR